MNRRAALSSDIKYFSMFPSTKTCSLFAVAIGKPLMRGATPKKRSVKAACSNRVHLSNRSKAANVTANRVRRRSTMPSRFVVVDGAATGRLAPGASKSEHCSQIPWKVPPRRISGKYVTNLR